MSEMVERLRYEAREFYGDSNHEFTEYELAWLKDEEDKGPPCPKCGGFRTVSCHCGGDLCVCDNNGEKDCPLCYGEGVADPARAEVYLKHQREMHEAMKKHWDALEAEKQQK